MLSVEIFRKWLLREFSSEPDLIADQPTRGIASERIHYSQRRSNSAARCCCRLVSADLSEVMEMSTGCLSCGGEIAACFDDTDTVADEVMGEYMLGLRRRDDEKIEEAAYV